jgi:predicted protein tyrosine phosphatase
MWMSIRFLSCEEADVFHRLDPRRYAAQLNGMTLPFRITVCGLAELDLHRDAKVSHVLSILDPEWPVPEEFGTYGEHAKLELRFHDIIENEPELLPPQRFHVAQLLEFGRTLEREPIGQAHLLVHCHAGISRSSASMALLIAQAVPDRPGAQVFADVLAIRPQIWPNLRIVEMGDALLERKGALVAAVAEIYRHQIAKEPRMAEHFRENGRAREVNLALGL